MFKHVFTIIALLFTITAHANPAAEELNDLLSSMQTLRAHYTQVTTDPRFTSEEVLTGNAVLKRPLQFRWEVLTPYKQLLVADGEKLWIYDEDLEQVTVQPLNESLNDAPALLLVGQDEDITEHYIVKVTPQQYTYRTFELIPIDEDSLLQTIYISFQGTVIKNMRLIDNLDQTIDITFQQVVINDPLPEDFFRFVPPAGVDVIGE